MRPRTILTLALIVATASCTALSGVGDLTIDESSPVASGDGSAAEAAAAGDGGTGPLPGAPDGSFPFLPGQDAGSDAFSASLGVICKGLPCLGHCCITQAGSGECSLSDKCADDAFVDLECDETSDCADGACCIEPSDAGPGERLLGVCRKAGTCAFGQLCATSADCKQGAPCEPLQSGGFPLGYGKGGCDL